MQKVDLAVTAQKATVVMAEPEHHQSKERMVIGIIVGGASGMAAALAAAENSNYRASFGYMDHNTIVKVNDYQNLVVKLDATQKAFDGRLTGDFGVYGYSSKIHDIFDSQALFYSADAMNPTYPYDKLNGSWVKNRAIGGQHSGLPVQRF